MVYQLLNLVIRHGNRSGCENLTLAIASPHGVPLRYGTPAWLIPRS